MEEHTIPKEKQRCNFICGLKAYELTFLWIYFAIEMLGAIINLFHSALFVLENNRVKKKTAKNLHYDALQWRKVSNVAKVVRSIAEIKDRRGTKQNF